MAEKFKEKPHIFGFSWEFPISDRVREFINPWYSGKTNPSLLSGGLALIREIASEKQNLHLCNTLDYSNWKQFQGWSKEFSEVQQDLYSHLTCGVSWISDTEQGGGSKRVWCDILRYQQKLRWLHSAAAFILSCPQLVSENSLKQQSAKVNETKLVQLTRGLTPFDCVIPKSLTSKQKPSTCNGLKPKKSDYSTCCFFSGSLVAHREEGDTST